MYGAGADMPGETVAAPGELERKMKEHFQKNPPIRRQVRDDDDEEEVSDDLGQSADSASPDGEEQQGDSNPIEGEGASTPSVNQTEKHVRGRSKAFLRGDQLFSTAAKVAKCRSENGTVRDICKRFDIDQAQYYALTHIGKYPTEFRQQIVSYDFSLNTVAVLGKFPNALRGQLCDLLGRRRLTTNALQEMLRLCKRDSDKMKSMCERFGILWPQSLDDSGNKRL
jgi:hypothetical protein